jgi:hypothetical protein
MSNTNNTTVTVGPSGLILLTIVLVLLKAYDKIDWPWLWVFAPIWIPAGVALAILAVMAVIVLVAFLIAILCGE